MIVEIFIGFIVTFTLIWIALITWTTYKSTQLTIDDPTNDPEYIELHNTPHCPWCNSYDLILIDDNAGVPWLKGRISELDHYRCKKCMEEFSDEDWSSVKVYNDQASQDD